MSATAWAAWLDRLESARGQQTALASKIRTGNAAAVGTSVFALQQTVSRLARDFEQLKRAGGNAVTKQELDRRQRLLDQLLQEQKSDFDAYNKRNTANGSSNGSSANNVSRDQASKLLGMQNQIMKDQDKQLDLIGKGVANLKNYSITAKDETDLHIRLLTDIDSDVAQATDGLATEGIRAKQVARQSSHFKLYITILILFVILIFLLVVGGGR